MDAEGGHPDPDAARALLAALVDSSDDAIFSKALDGTILTWNQGAERLYGYSAEEMVGKSVAVLLPPTLQGEIEGILERFKLGEVISHFETVRIHKSGAVVPVSLTISPIKDADGTIVGASTIARDISRRLEADGQRFHLAALVDSSNSAISSKTLDGTILSWNPAAEKLYGYSADEIVGKSIFVLVPPDRLGEVHDMLERIQRGEVVDNLETLRLHKDGTAVPVSVSVSPIRDAAGTIVAASTIARETRIGDDRDRSAKDRDMRADEHDLESKIRDDRGEARDQRADARDEAAIRFDPEAAADRAAAVRDRRGAAVDRMQAADDREAAATDRHISARERAVSSIDEFTGAYRRDAGTLELERETTRAQRTGRALVLAYVDVDGLKARNDSMGHAAGDQLLRHAVDGMRAHLRSYDLIVRVGGDEFVCALLDMTRSDAAKRFEAINVDLGEIDQGSITVGLAELQADDSLESLIARADAALYEKRGQRPRAT